MNLSVLKRTRRLPSAGDIFVMKPPDDQFLFGRVIATDAVIGPIKNCILIYVYRARSLTKVSVPILLRGQLLIPPMMTNGLPWVKGYFELVDHQPLDPIDRLPRHCFRDTRGWYFDQYSNRLTSAEEPLGSWGLDSYRTIDDKISQALGIPMAQVAGRRGDLPDPVR